MVPSSLTLWSKAGIGGGGKSANVITRTSPVLMISEVGWFVPLAVLVDAIPTWLAGAVPPAAIVSIPGTSEKLESGLSVWHPANRNPVSRRHDTMQRRLHTCPTFVINMEPLNFLTPLSHRGQFDPLRHERQAPPHHCENSNRGNSHCNSNSSRLATY